MNVLENYVRVYILNKLRRNDIISYSRILVENKK